MVQHACLMLAVLLKLKVQMMSYDVTGNAIMQM